MHSVLLLTHFRNDLKDNPLKDLQRKIVLVHATLSNRFFFFLHYWYITVHHSCSEIIELHQNNLYKVILKHPKLWFKEKEKNIITLNYFKKLKGFHKT